MVKLGNCNCLDSKLAGHWGQNRRPWWKYDGEIEEIYEEQHITINIIKTWTRHWTEKVFENCLLYWLWEILIGTRTPYYLVSNGECTSSNTHRPGLGGYHAGKTDREKAHLLYFSFCPCTTYLRQTDPCDMALRDTCDDGISEPYHNRTVSKLPRQRLQYTRRNGILFLRQAYVDGQEWIIILKCTSANRPTVDTDSPDRNSLHDNFS